MAIGAFRAVAYLVGVSTLISCQNSTTTGLSNFAGQDTSGSKLVYKKEVYDETAYGQFVDTSHHYRLDLDNDGWSMIKPDQNHQKLYVSSSSGDDSNDGLSESSPLASFSAAFSKIQSPASFWILLKRGDQFDDLGRLRPWSGQSAQHPQLIGAYGQGDRPLINGTIRLWDNNQNIALIDLHFKKEGKYCIDVLGNVSNLLIENVVTEGCESRIQSTSESDHLGVSLRRVQILDAHQPAPHDDASDWTAAHINRISGIYISGVDGLLIEESFADRNGWQEGYSEQGAAGPQPPSMYSHNFYIQTSNKNVIYRGNISTRGASTGAQIRPGGVVQRNIFIANNIAFFTAGVSASLVEKNVVTIAGNKKAPQIGALGWGMSSQNVVGTTLSQNMVLHSLDPLQPNLPDFANGAMTGLENTQMKNNLVYQWGSSSNVLDHASTSTNLDQISILDYSLRSKLNTDDLSMFLSEFRKRDRDYWPQYLQATSIFEYFSQALSTDL